MVLNSIGRMWCFVVKELESFKFYLMAERNLSENTFLSYDADIRQFFAEVPKTIKQVKTEDVSAFIIKLRKDGLKVSSTNRKLSSLKAFFRFMVKKGIIKFNPAEPIDSGKMERLLPKPIDQENIEKLIAIADNSRDRLIFEILYGIGVRREELVNIKVKDINFARGYIKVYGKGGKERLIPIYPKLAEMIKAFAGTSNGWLFPSRKFPGQHLSLRQVNEIVDKWVAKAGLKGKNITPHKFRHSFCSHLFENGAELKTIQDMAGHSNANSTQIYTKVSNNRNRKEILSHHPRAKIS